MGHEILSPPYLTPQMSQESSTQELSVESPTGSKQSLEPSSPQTPDTLKTEHNGHISPVKPVAMATDTDTIREENEKEDLKTLKEKAVADYDAMVKQKRVQRLTYLLEKSSLYANDTEEKEEIVNPSRRSTRISTKNDDTEQNNSTHESVVKRKSVRTRKRKNEESTYISDYTTAEELAKRRKNLDETATPVGSSAAAKQPEKRSARQPKLITGGALREYQLAGLEWLVSLYDNGLNGILADEMGLGKTLQTIAFFAYLWERRLYGPYLIVAPLSTLANWVSEFQRWSPSIPVVLYHGTPEQRTHIRNKRLRKIDHTFPVVVTSYEIVMNDRKYLQKLAWKFIVVDEGHRIKNLNCKLIRELKSYQSANRLLLTGTPLQNNLVELWSLLNFLLPDIFDDLDSFQNWFDFSALNEENGQQRILAEEQENMIISNLHKILKPFVLRRLKTDVENALPKKKEYLLFAPISAQQKALYDAVLRRDIRQYLVKMTTGKSPNDSSEPMDIHEEPSSAESETDSETDEKSTEISPEKLEAERKRQANERKRSLRQQQRIRYAELSDKRYFDSLKGDNESGSKEKENTTAIAKEKASEDKAVRFVNSLKLQNIVMQLRKVCNHPYLFDWPADPDTSYPLVSEELVTSSGKMMLLDRLLSALFERDHKVLLFSQFTTMLDIIEEWAVEIKGWKICRIDGSVKQEDRRDQIQAFNTSPDMKLFILSTRAGGLGINLTAADTVIIYDSDWNPQMDLQAQDRCHRIGQTKPVVIYRLVTVNTVESKIIEKATAKRKLEKLVMHRGKFKVPSGESKSTTLGELAEILASEDNEQVHLVQKGDVIIPDEDLERLLDRSDKSFSKMEAGAAEEERGETFKVISEVRNKNNDALANMDTDDEGDGISDPEQRSIDVSSVSESNCDADR